MPEARLKKTREAYRPIGYKVYVSESLAMLEKSEALWTKVDKLILPRYEEWGNGFKPK